MTSRPRVLVVAHRGSSGTAPENTLAAFRLAIEAGVDMIEIDIRMTRDYHLVVHHDRRLGRTNNGTGFVWDRSLQELRLLDAGSWYSPKFRGEPIPSLREVMDMVPPGVGLNIEVKTDGDPRKNHALEESCILMVRERGFEKRVIFSSFDHKLLRRLHSLDPEVQIGALYVPVRDMAKKPSAIARRTGAAAFICSRTQLRRRQVIDAHEHAMKVAVYGVNSVTHLSEVLRSGADVIVTDFPERMVRALRARRPERTSS